MSEGIDLSAFPRAARHTLLPEVERVARLEAAAPQIVAATTGEADPIVIQATLASLLWETFSQASWVGFYRRVGREMLAVGPYQGPMGCLRIALDRGVCGACARTREVQIVPDVEAFPGHIACDSSTRSELVLPVFGAGEVQAVLDFDSRSPSAFSLAEADRVARLLAAAFGDGVAWPRWS